MIRRVIGLFTLPWREDLEVSAPLSHNPLKMHHWAFWYKANPRDKDYMRPLFQRQFPEGDFINLDKDPEWRAAVDRADEVILLYPDAIGLGFGRLEREVKRLLKPWAGIRVLNGRRRTFRLGLLLPPWAKKPWARRFGGSLWITGNKA